MIITCYWTIFEVGKNATTYFCTWHLNMFVNISRGNNYPVPPGCGPACEYLYFCRNTRTMFVPVVLIFWPSAWLCTVLLRFSSASWEKRLVYRCDGEQWREVVVDVFSECVSSKHLKAVDRLKWNTSPKFMYVENFKNALFTKPRTAGERFFCVIATSCPLQIPSRSHR